MEGQQQWTAEDDEYWNHLHQCHVFERPRFSVDCASLLCGAVLVVPSLLCAAVNVAPSALLDVLSAVSRLVSGLQAT